MAKTLRKPKEKYREKTNFVILFLLCVACLILFLGKDNPLKSNSGSHQDLAPPKKEAITPPQIVIQYIRLQPSHPTRRDSLHAEVLLSESAKTSGKSFQYTYAWKINNQPVPYESSDTLELADFKVGDWVTVTITPYDSAGTAPAKTSHPLKIRAVPPSLELQTTKYKITPGETFICQLISQHPDSETVTFSLEEPKLEGMTIHAQTGRITWSIPSLQKNTWQFGASVMDPGGSKTTETFTISINPDSSASANTN